MRLPILSESMCMSCSNHSKDKEVVMTVLLALCLAPAWLSQPIREPLRGQYNFL